MLPGDLSPCTAWVVVCARLEELKGTGKPSDENSAVTTTIIRRRARLVPTPRERRANTAGSHPSRVIVLPFPNPAQMQTGLDDRIARSEPLTLSEMTAPPALLLGLRARSLGKSAERVILSTQLVSTSWVLRMTRSADFPNDLALNPKSSAGGAVISDSVRGSERAIRSSRPVCIWAGLGKGRTMTREGWLPAVLARRSLGVGTRRARLRMIVVVTALFSSEGLPVPLSSSSLAQTTTQAVQGERSPGSISKESPAGPIPLPQIANRADELESALNDISMQLAANQEKLPTVEQGRQQISENLERLRLLDDLIASGPTARNLRDEGYYWSTLKHQYAGDKEFLISQATFLENQLRFLDSQQMEWQRTNDEIRKSAGMKTVTNRVAQELERIHSTRRDVEKQLALLLTLQDQVSQVDGQIASASSKINRAQGQLRGDLLEKNGYPIWESRLVRELEPPMTTAGLREAAGRDLREARDYARVNLFFVFAFALIYVLALVGALKFKRYVEEQRNRGLPDKAFEIFSRPFSVALFVALLATIGRYDRITTTVALVLAWLWLIQALRLITPLVGPESRLVFRVMIFFLALESLRFLIPFSAIPARG